MAAGILRQAQGELSGDGASGDWEIHGGTYQNHRKITDISMDLPVTTSPSHHLTLPDRRLCVNLGHSDIL